MRVLLTNIALESRAGSETYLLDVARWLREHGHTPVAFSPRLGPFADEVRRAGIPVVDDPVRIGQPPDVIHGHHHLATMAALAAFPDVATVSFCHGSLSWEEAPARHPAIRRYIAVSGATRERLVTEAGVLPSMVRVLPNFVDVNRFRPRPPLPPAPRRALLFSNAAPNRGGWVDEVRAACEARGIALDVAGTGSGAAINAPERLLPSYDLVFGRGRCALEAMAVGAAVVLCDAEGIGPLVTIAEFDRLREGNFGMQVLSMPHDRVALGQEMDRYDSALALETSVLVRSTLSRDVVVPGILATYHEAIEEAIARPVTLEEARHAERDYLRWLDAAIAQRLTRGGPATGARGLVRYLLPPLWHTRERLLPIGTRRFRAYRRLRSVARRAHRNRLSDDVDDAPTPAEVATVVPPDVRLSCVVLDVGGQPGLVDSVRSVLAQQPVPEVVVVSSGPDGAEGLLRDAGLGVELIHVSDRLMPGAARNVGIAATHEPWIAFLAADCTAAPGWTAGRSAAHAAGARIVSSAVTNASPWNPFETAAHCLLFAPRLAGTPRAARLHYGASYDRALFGEVGRFRDDLRIGEDTEFHARAASLVSPVFRPDVRIAHRNPETLAALLRDQAMRGRRSALARHELYAEPLATARRTVASDAVTRVGRSLTMSLRATSIRDWAAIGWASPWMVAGAAAYAVGAATAKAPPSPSVASHGRLRLVCLIQFHDERDRLPGFLENVAPHVDGIIALDDGSTDGSDAIMRGHPLVVEMLRVAPRTPHVWDELRNRRLLIDAAVRHGVEWAIAVDADERVERDLRSRAERELVRAEREGHLAYGVALRELWDRPDRYRVDGVWGRKRHARLFRIRPDHDVGAMALHGHWAPENSRGADGRFATADLVIYHLAMIDRDGREARKRKYEQLDPEARWQSIGYAYLTDEKGMVLEALPDGRDYVPLP